MTAVVQVINPATGDVSATLPAPTAEELEKALARAQTGSEHWHSQTLKQRRNILLIVADLLQQRRDELVCSGIEECVKVFGEEAVDEVELVAETLPYPAEHGFCLVGDAPVPYGPDDTISQRPPAGVIKGFVPWKCHYYQDEGKSCSAPTLRAAHTGPSSRTKTSSLHSLSIRACMPCPLSVTGCGRAGSAVAAATRRHLKKCVLELGGAPLVLLDTDDVEASVGLAATPGLENCAKRVTHQAIHRRCRPP